MKKTGWKKKLENYLTYSERINLIEKNKEKISITRQSKLLSISKSSLYYDNKASDRDMEIMNKIDEIYTEFPYYGTRRISMELQNIGYKIGRKKTRKYMQTMGIQAIYPKKKTTTGNKQHKKYPYLLKKMDIIKPNQVWAADITYIRLKHGRVYLIVIIDWYSRYILSWELSLTLENYFCISTLKKSIAKYGRPDIFNTDQGSQFTSEDFTSILRENNIQISMDGKGRRIDNIIVERVFRTIKYEEVFLKDYKTPKDAYYSLSEYIDKYNNKRLHSTLGYKTPVEIYGDKQKFNNISVDSLQYYPLYYDYEFNNVISLK